MVELNQIEAYDEAKQYLLYAEKIVERSILAHDELLARKLKSALITTVADIAHLASLIEQSDKDKMKTQIVALLHEIIASFDIAFEKRLIQEETFAKLKDKTDHLLSHFPYA